jgi:hypothetical protein
MAIKPYSQSNYGALSAVEQDDGSFNYPIYGVQANTYTGPNLQDVYGTAAMPMFQWVERIQTGQGSFNPEDPADNEMLKKYEDFLKNNPQAQMEMPSTAQIIGKALTPMALATGAALGTQFAGGGMEAVNLGPALGEGFKTMGGKGLSPILSDKTDVKGFSKNLDLDAKDVDLRRQLSEGLKQTPVKAGTGELFDYTTTAGKANWISNAGAGAASFGLNLLTGKDPVKAAKAAGATTILGVAGTALGSMFGLGPLGGWAGRLLGNEFGGRVICNELMSQGLADRKQVVMDYRFTRDYLTPTHVKGYHVWAVWMVKQMRKGRFVKFWSHVAGHRANEIAYIYGERDKPDYLGKVYRKIFEPVCWTVGIFCEKTDWSILYNKKEI